MPKTVAVAKPAMTVAEAAEIWLANKPVYDEAKRKVDDAGEVLKAYFRRTKRTSYKGKIGYAISTYAKVSSGLARSVLGTRVSEVLVDVDRETLSLLK